MAQGYRPLAVKTPDIGATWCKVVGDAFDGCQVGRVLIKT